MEKVLAETQSLEVRFRLTEILDGLRAESAGKFAWSDGKEYLVPEPSTREDREALARLGFVPPWVRYLAQ
jgi:hypothetical protein